MLKSLNVHDLSEKATRPKTLNNRLRKAPKEFPKAFHQDSPKRIQLIYTRKHPAARKHSSGICPKAFHEDALVSIRLESTRKHTSEIHPKAWHGFEICTGGGKRPKAYHGFQVCTKGIEKRTSCTKVIEKKGSKFNQKHQIIDSEKPETIKTQVKTTRKPNTSNHLFKRRKADHPK